MDDISIQILTKTGSHTMGGRRRATGSSWVKMVLAALACWWLIGSPAPAQDAGAAAYPGLRDRALHVRPDDLGLTFPADVVAAYGVVMDVALNEGAATLVAFSTGDASLYLSSGHGVMGGGGPEPVRKAARDLVAAARDHVLIFAPATDLDPPRPGEVRFFLLTSRGVLSASVSGETLGRGKTPAAAIWRAAKPLLAALQPAEGGEGE